jgi:hypothetical protein
MEIPIIGESRRYYQADPHCDEDMNDYIFLLARLAYWVHRAELGKLDGGNSTVLHWWRGYLDTWDMLNEHPKSYESDHYIGLPMPGGE